MVRKLWFEHALLSDGWASRVQITIEGGRVVKLGRDVAPAPEAERHGVALPGLPNVHSHAFQRGAAGRTGLKDANGDSFWSWRSTLYGLASRLTPDAARAMARLAYVEMLEAGFTRVGEFHYLHHDVGGAPYGDLAEMAGQHLEAAAEAGLDMTLLPVFYAHADVAGAPPTPGQARFVCDRDQYAALIEACRLKVATYEGARLGVAPHSLRAVSPAELQDLALLSPTDPIHIHIAEQDGEVRQCLAVLGARPVDWLLDHAEVNERWCLVHATHVTPREVQRLAASGGTVGLCPITEADLGDGVFPAADFQAAGGRFGIGSDSNVLIDAAAELRLLEYGQRLTLRRRNVLARPPWSVGRTLFEGALDGARVLGEDRGAIVEGGWATFVGLDAGHVALADCRDDQLLDAWIFAARTSPIDGVWRRGQRLVRDGVHIHRPAFETAYRAALIDMRGG